MKFLWNDKDGGLESKVWCYGIEFKSLFSIVLLRFENGSREAYHSHAFNCLNWVLRGGLIERRKDLKAPRLFYTQTLKYKPSVMPFIIKRDHLHKVSGVGRTWVLSFRGPWSETWKEFVDGKLITLTHGRKEV